MKRISLFLVVISFACAAQAQSKISYTSGIKAGANAYKLDIADHPDEYDEKLLLDFHAGVFFKVPITSMFSLQPEILYSGEGSKFKYGTIESKTHLRYLAVPVMFQVNTSAGVHFETGPQLGVLIQAKNKIDNDGTEEELKLTTQLKQTNFAWGIGVGYRISNVGIGARYLHGLTNISLTDEFPERKTRGFQAGLSYYFDQK